MAMIAASRASTADHLLRPKAAAVQAAASSAGITSTATKRTARGPESAKPIVRRLRASPRPERAARPVRAHGNNVAPKTKAVPIKVAGAKTVARTTRAGLGPPPWPGLRDRPWVMLPMLRLWSL